MVDSGGCYWCGIILGTQTALMSFASLAIVIGVAVQIVVLMGIIFKGGEFVGRMTTLVDNLRNEVADLKTDMKGFRER